MKKIIILIFLMFSTISNAQDTSLWFQVTEFSYWENGEGHRSRQADFKMNIDIRSDEFTNGIIKGYTKERFTIHLLKERNLIKNEKGTVFEWSFIDNADNRGIATLYANNSGTFQLVLKFADADYAVIYNMHPI